MLTLLLVAVFKLSAANGTSLSPEQIGGMNTCPMSFSMDDHGQPLALFSDSNEIYRLLSSRPGRGFSSHATFSERCSGKSTSKFHGCSFLNKKIGTERQVLTIHFRFVVSCCRYVVALRHLLC